MSTFNAPRGEKISRNIGKTNFSMCLQFKNTSAWPIFRRKDSQYQKSTGKCKLKAQGDTTSHPLKYSPGNEKKAWQKITNVVIGNSINVIIWKNSPMDCWWECRVKIYFR